MNQHLCVVGSGTSGLVTALIAKSAFPNIKVTVISSKEIGIIGVGEGSTEHWVRFMDYINISVEEVIYETRATVKIGILFKDWNNDSTEYVHSLHKIGRAHV